MIKCFYLFLVPLVINHSVTYAAMYSTLPSHKVGKINSTEDYSAHEGTSHPQLSDNIKTTHNRQPEVQVHIKGEVLYLTPQACRKILIHHIPAESLTYKPNMTGEGKPLKPVDLNPPEIKPEGVLRIPIRYLHRTRENSRTSRSSADSSFLSDYSDEIPLVFLEFSIENGKVLFNGHQLTEETYQIIRQKCHDFVE